MGKLHLAARLFFVSMLAALPAFGLAEASAATVPISATTVTARTIEPANGEVVGIAAAIIVGFLAPVADRTAAEQSITIAPSRPVPGHFSWANDSEVRWSPDKFWPANTSVTVQAVGARSQFDVGDGLVAVANTSTHQFVVSINGQVVQTMPASMGKAGHETPDGTFPIMEKYKSIVMDSSTYGVPVDSPEGYRLNVQYAVRITWGGIFVHAAPWSVGSQGYSNVSHGCINLSTDNAAWFFNNAKVGDPVIVTS